MGFIDSYKCLEKLCGEVLGVEKGGVTGYIDAMKALENGRVYVPNWDAELKALKHYRWIRNQIAHEPNCNENNMCKSEDVAWIEGFYARIKKQTDPLALYRKAVKPRAAKPVKRVVVQQSVEQPQTSKSLECSGSTGESGCLKIILGLLLVVAIVLMFYLELRPHNL